MSDKKFDLAETQSDSDARWIVLPMPAAIALVRLARAARAYLTPWPVNDDPDDALFTELVAAADAFTDSAEPK